MTYTTRTTVKASDSELVVITKARDICSYVLTIMAKSPKRFRFTLATKLQNYALEAAEQMYLANEIYPSGEHKKEMAEQRHGHQDKAMAALKMLGWLAHLAAEQGCILQKQYETLAGMLYGCMKLLTAWKKL